MIRKAVLQIGAPLLLAFIAWNAYLAINHLRGVETMATFTLGSAAIQAEVSAVLKDVTDMETGQRGYLLTGDPAYLQPYSDAKGRIEPDVVTLRTMFSQRSQREQSLEAQLESLFQSKIGEMDRSISLRQQGYRHRSFKLVETNEGRNYMDDIRRITSLLASAESSNFGRLDHERKAALKGVLNATLIANLAVLLLAACLFGLIRHYLRLLEEDAAQSRTELVIRDLQLDKLTSALCGQARSNIIAINTNSCLLLENYGGFLPRQGHEYAEQMKVAAAEMERLRQDLVGSPTSAANERVA